MRELVLELRDGQSRLEEKVSDGFSKRPTRAELAIAGTLLSGVVLGIVAV